MSGELATQTGHLAGAWVSLLVRAGWGPGLELQRVWISGQLAAPRLDQWKMREALCFERPNTQTKRPHYFRLSELV